MKVLFIGHYHEASGSGVAARNLIQAMDSVGIDLVCRPIKLSRNVHKMPDRILELESRKIDGCEVCIQFVLPHHFCYHAGYKNIAYYMTETHGWNLTSWPNHINLMDEAWVPCEEMCQYAKQDGIRVPIKLVPLPTDVSKYTKQYRVPNIPELNGNYVFYFIGEMNRRKHLSAILRAFHGEFATGEPVSLLFKLDSYTKSPSQISREFDEAVGDIKKQMKLYKSQALYKNEIIITNYLSDEDIYGLHQRCNCLVYPSFGEAFGYVPLDAMGFNKTVIATRCGGMADFLSDYNLGRLITGYPEPLMGVEQYVQEFTTSREWWWNISVKELQNNMRQAFESRKHAHIFNGRIIANRYSYQNIGEQIKDLL